MKATVGSLVDLAALSHPELVELFPEIETNQQILRYRMEYQSFRLGYAQGAKGEVTEVTSLHMPSLTSGASSGNVLGITGSDSLAEELDTSFAVLREYRISYRRHRLGQPRGAAGQVEDLAKKLSMSDCRLLPAAQLAEFNAQMKRWKESLERKDLSDVAGVHVHAGAGRLGLGLVLPAIVSSGRPYAVVQRPSAAWSDAMQAGKVQMKLNGTLLAELLVVRNLRELEEAFAAEQKAMLVLSENQDVLCALVARTTSYSCAIGGKDLVGALAPITKAINHLAKESSGTFAVDAGKPVVPLYACENDHEAVEGLAVQMEGLIEVVPVLVDRVCTGREMCKDGSVDVATEEYQGELVLTPPANLDHPRPPLPFKGDNVRVPLTPEGAAFLHRKKILSVNGTHTTIAFLTLIAGEIGTVGPPKGDHELLSYEIEAAAEGRAATADPVGRAVWVWIVARQLMLLYEFDETVVKQSLGITSSGSDSDMDLIDVLLGSAKIAAARLSNGGDMTSRVLGGGVENRWRTRLCNVQEFLTGVTLSRLSRKLILKAGISEIELRSSVSKLVKDSKRFVMVARPRSPSPRRDRFTSLPRALPKRQESPSAPGAREAHSSEPRFRRPGWLLSPSEKAGRRSSESPQRHVSLPEVPPMPLKI
jgi:hypothetical protein